MRVVFLDFYGVMNPPRGEDTGLRLDPRRGAMIEELCERTGAVVVIISDAVKRYRDSDRDLFPDARYDLVDIGIREDRIVGCTDQGPDSIASYHRPREIRDWLDAHPEVTSYVILDDKPLPFTEEEAEELWWGLEGCVGPGATRCQDALLLEGDPEMAARFIQVDGDKRLTVGDVERAVAILEGGTEDDAGT